MTTDGASNEKGAAALLVNEGNEIHCVAHNLQLAINDPLDPKKANPPADCAAHRGVLQKAHKLVIHINGHRSTFHAFSTLAQQKKVSVEGSRQFDALVIDVETRWDSELALLERLVYFDNEIMSLYGNAELGIEADMMLDRAEFDLAFGMTLVLEPFRIFTKFVQYRNDVTLAYVPGHLDRLLTQLAPGTFATRLLGRAPGVLAQVEAFQARLVASLRERFADLFTGRSLALASRMLLPGRDLFTFRNFVVGEDVIAEVKTHMLNDFVELLPAAWDADRKQRYRNAAAGNLDLLRDELNQVDPDVNPLQWWPTNPAFGSLYLLAKMLLAIPASTAEDERVFSGAGVTLNERRTRLDIDNFRREHRVRQFLTSGTSLNTREGRHLRIERGNTLLRHFGELFRAHAQERGAADEQGAAGGAL